MSEEEKEEVLVNFVIRIRNLVGDEVATQPERDDFDVIDDYTPTLTTDDMNDGQ